MAFNTQSNLKEILYYDKKDGNMYWKISPKNGILPWSKAGTFDKDRYVCVVYKHKSYKVHRLAWLYVHGEWPQGEIDHINRNPSDNSIQNLRVVTRKQNEENKTSHLDNVSGFKGVTFDKRRKTWFARIMHNKKTHHLGTYKNPEDAAIAYQNAAKIFHTHNFVNKELS